MGAGQRACGRGKRAASRADQAKGNGQSVGRVSIGVAVAALEALDRARAQASSLGEDCLGQAGRDAVAAEHNAEG